MTSRRYQAAEFLHMQGCSFYFKLEGYFCVMFKFISTDMFTYVIFVL